MGLSVNFNESDSTQIENVANNNKISAPEFVREVTMKAVRNAAYLAKLNRADEQIKSGKYRIVSWEELEALANE